MHLIKVASGCLNQTPLDWDGNFINIINAIEDAKKDGASILCLPELTVCGYNCEDSFHSFNTIRESFNSLLNILPYTSGIAVCIGLPLYYHNGLFNAVAMVANGELLGFVCKQYLAGDGIHYEPRWFKAWPKGKVSEYYHEGVKYPIGDIFFSFGGIRVGFEICEEAWVAKRPGAILAERGIDVILNPSASHFAFEKFEVRKRFVCEGSRAFGVTYIYSNLIGTEAGRSVYDGGSIIASGGKLVAVGERFFYSKQKVVSAVVDIELSRIITTRTGSFSPNVEASGVHCVVSKFTPPKVGYMPPNKAARISDSLITSKYEEFSLVLPLAMFDYMRKSFSHGFVLSLSGGADSSAVAVLVRLSVELAVNELGLAGFKERLSYFKRIQNCNSIDSIMSEILFCVYQRAENSSFTTLDAAQTLAKGVGATFYEFNVTNVINEYTKMVESSLGRELTWEQDDIALQNIQARARAPSVWMVANIKGALLVATSNRSEAAVGYATMDGDTAGGLSPLAGIDKAFLRTWLKWIEVNKTRGNIGSFASLHKVNVQEPTAELRPQSVKQTDEKDLMPYEVLNLIEVAAIRDKKAPKEVVEILEGELTGVSKEQITDWVKKFFTLWCRNQWKRERYAPSFHLDDSNLDPKSWCRFPILCGNYQKEFKEL